jgi:hypothetical protein
MGFAEGNGGRLLFERNSFRVLSTQAAGEDRGWHIRSTRIGNPPIFQSALASDNCVVAGVRTVTDGSVWLLLLIRAPVADRIMLCAASHGRNVALVG